MRHVIAMLILVATTVGAQAQRPVVVELFTSQGCSSCPPAEALLSELASQPGVLALGFHVTYWNGLGWRDPFSLDAATTRQRSYQALLRTDTIYTPQMVVDGRIDVIGSDRRAVSAALARARATETVSVEIHRDGGRVTMQLGSGAGTARVLLVGYDGRHRTDVSRGENAGRALVESNVVRSLAVAGEWAGQSKAIVAELPVGEHVAVVLQDRSGAILGAAAL